MFQLAAVWVALWVSQQLLVDWKTGLKRKAEIEEEESEHIEQERREVRESEQIAFCSVLCSERIVAIDFTVAPCRFKQTGPWIAR